MTEAAASVMPFLTFVNPDGSRLTFFGDQEDKVISQFKRCVEPGSPAVLCADAHFGYSQPVGAVVAYRGKISPSGVGYDIGCGNKAVRTNKKVGDFDVVAVMDEIKRVISFGMGLHNNECVDHPVLTAIADSHVASLFKERPPQIGKHPRLSLLERAEKQLGTVGGGNHYVDLLVDADDAVWIGVHFGSRGFGHGVASGFLALSQSLPFTGRAQEGEMESPPVLFDAATPLGQDYLHAMELAGRYAYAGRDWVVDRVLRILGAAATYSVHQNHNYAWRETHFGEDYFVVRKGATPAFPGQQGFVGGSMGDISVILEGVESERSAQALYSTVHGAGRVMSRTEAKGKFKKGKRIKEGRVNWDEWNRKLKADGIVIRGGDADEAPECYRPLESVLAHHAGTIRILHMLRPIGVAMAGYADGPDWYKD